MPAVIVRNISEETHRALKLRAARNGRSREAEIRVILEATVSSKPSKKLGSRLAALGRRYGGIDIGDVRDRTPAMPAKFK